jgi:hypothetical protein
MSYTRRDWSVALLNAIGNSNPTEKTILWLIAWTHAETTSPPGAEYNLLNTTEPNTPGVVSDFNSVGVKNYDTFAHGIQANAKVLNNGFYPTLYTFLKTNSNGLYTVNDDINHQLSTWGTGPVQASIISGAKNPGNESFPGTGPRVEETKKSLKDDSVALAEFRAVIKDLPILGIGNAWYDQYKAGIYHGPALTSEVTVGRKVYQYFAGSTCIWDKDTNTANWHRYS